MSAVMPLVEHADRVGIDSVWAAEAYGSDAVTVLAYIAGRTSQIKVGSAILQIPARTPANTAMTAMTLDAMSDGRFLCGIGMSGPQVVEGWHGVAYGKPLVRTREAIEIMRAVWARSKPVTHAGEHYTIPVDGGTGLGKPLKSILHPRPDIPSDLAAIGPKNLELAAGLCDGVLPTLFSPYRSDVIRGHLTRAKPGFDLVTPCRVTPTDDVQAALDAVKPNLALYIGGMGARG